MAIVSSFLCWSNTRTGSAVCGYYTLIISVVCLAFYMLRYIALDEMKDSIELKGIVYAGFVLYSFLIGVSLILLPGVYMDRKFFLLPWMYVLVITVLYETSAIALITTVHLEQDHTLNTWEIIAVAFYCIRLVANCYCFACVVSQYQELSEGRGTYEFLFKPRRRHMARGAPMTDIDEYHPPYGVSLPPYSEENPYKEYSPPNYENLAIDFGDLETPRRGRRHNRSRNRSARVAVSSPAARLAEVVVNPCPAAGYHDIEVDEDGEGYLDHFHHQAYLHSAEHQQLGTCLCDVHPHDIQYHFLQPPPGHRGNDTNGRHHHHHHERAPSYASADGDARFQNSRESTPEIVKRCLHSREVSLEIHSPPDAIEVESPDESGSGERRVMNISTTDSSGSFIQPSPSPSSFRSHSSSPALLPSHLRGKRSPPAIQKRTYITWI